MNRPALALIQYVNQGFVLFLLTVSSVEPGKAGGVASRRLRGALEGGLGQQGGQGGIAVIWGDRRSDRPIMIAHLNTLLIHPFSSLARSLRSTQYRRANELLKCVSQAVSGRMTDGRNPGY